MSAPSPVPSIGQYLFQNRQRLLDSLGPQEIPELLRGVSSAIPPSPSPPPLASEIEPLRFPARPKR